MVAGAVITVPYCGSCGYDANNGLHNDVFCDACGADLNQFGFTGLFPPPDIEGARGTDEVVVTFTAALDTQDILYSIDGAASVFDDDVASPYTIAAPAVASVEWQVRTVLNGVAGPWSNVQSEFSAQAPPTVLTATATAGGALDVVFAFTADPAGDTVDLLYTVDAGPGNTVFGVVTGVAIAGLLGEVISGQVRTVQDGVAGVYSSAAADTIVA